jgi:hypothetical protein
MGRAQRLAGRRPGGGPPTPHRHRSARPSARYSPRGNRFATSSPARSAFSGAPRRGAARRASMTSMMTCRVAAGGDMSTPQKRPPTRHYLQKTSDNRRSGRLRATWSWRPAAHIPGHSAAPMSAGLARRTSHQGCFGVRLHPSDAKPRIGVSLARTVAEFGKADGLGRKLQRPARWHDSLRVCRFLI